MSVHYKFKSTLDYDTVSFDGLHISVADLKKAIFHQKRIGKNTDFDLQITNAQTKEDYTDDNALIAKNTSLIVARVPLTIQQKRSWDRNEQPAFANSKDESNMGRSVDLTRLDGSEEDKIRAMMTQSTQDYDPSNYMKIRGANQTGEVPPNYRCYKCHQPGHWIKNCPSGIDREPIEIKKSTGIPRSFMVPVEGPLVPGAMMTPTGHYAVPAIDHQAYKEGKKERPPFAHDPEPVVEKPEIPEDLLCNICKDLLTDAVMIPCCGNSFCDECIRTVLLESEEHECPDCSEKDVSPETLIPNRFLRNAVMNFKNETGYAKRQTYRPTQAASSQQPVVKLEKPKVENVQPASSQESGQSGAPTSQTPIASSVPSQEFTEKPADLAEPATSTIPQQYDEPPPPALVAPASTESPPEPETRADTVTKLITDEETEVPPPPGTEPLLPIPALGGSSPDRDLERGEGKVDEKKDQEDDYSDDQRPRERRRSFSKDSHRERSGDHGRRIENLRTVSRRRSLSPRNSHRGEYLPSSHPMNHPASKNYQVPPPGNARYQPNMHYCADERDIRRSTEERPGTPTVDEPHLHGPPSVGSQQPPLLPYPPGEDRLPAPPPAQPPQPNYNQPPPNIAPHNALLPDPYMAHRIPLYPHQQGGPHYGPPRYDRPPYQQTGYRGSQIPRNYNGPPRPMRGMHHLGYRGVQPPPPGLGRTINNGNPPGVIDDPLEAFERMLREKDERDRRLGKHRRRSRTRSRSRSYTRSRSRSFGRRSPLPARISRSRSPPPKRRASRSPLPMRQRSRTPKRRSRSGSFSISRSRSYSRSQSPRGSLSRDRERDRERERERDRERDRERERDLPPRYRSPVRSPPRFHRERERERERPRSREPREPPSGGGYNSYYNDSPAHDYGFRDRERELPPPPRERPGGGARYPPRNHSSSQHNIPPLLPHLLPGGPSTHVHQPPPLMSLGPPPPDRKDYYDSYNRYSGPGPQRFAGSGSPLRDTTYKRPFDDVAPPGTEGYYDLPPPGVDHPEKFPREDREKSRLSKEHEERERVKEQDVEDRERLPIRDDRNRERDERMDRGRERDERGERRIMDRERERERERDRDRDDQRERPPSGREHQDRMREKEERERREKEKERDERHVRDRRDEERQIDKRDYDKERYRDDRERHRIEDKSSRGRERDRKDRDYEMDKERERHERYEGHSADRKKAKKSSSPHPPKSRNDVKETASPERVKRKDKDHEERSDEKKKDKKIKEKKKKKDGEEKEKKKKKKKEKRSTQKDITKDDAPKATACETADSRVDEKLTQHNDGAAAMKVEEILRSETVTTEESVEPPKITMLKETFEDKSLAMNPEPPEVMPDDKGALEAPELGTNPPNPNFKPIPEAQVIAKPVESLYGGLDDRDINETVVPDKYSLHLTGDPEEADEEEEARVVRPMQSTSEEDTTSAISTGGTSSSLTATQSTKVVGAPETDEKSPKKDEFLAQLPELSKWEREETTEKSDAVVESPSTEEPTAGVGDESKSTKVVTSEVLKRAENAIFQKAINAIRPIEIKKISESRKILYQNPEPKIIEPEPARAEPRKSVNVTINVGRNERNVEITEPSKKANKLDRTKFKPVPESHSPTRLSAKERLGDKVDDEKDRKTGQGKNFMERRDSGKSEAPQQRSRSPRGSRDRRSSPTAERRADPPNVSNSERKVFLDDRKRDRERNERPRDRIERHESRGDSRSDARDTRDTRIDNRMEFRSSRNESRSERSDRERSEKERERADRRARTPPAQTNKREEAAKPVAPKRKETTATTASAADEEVEKKKEKKPKEEKKRKKEHRSRSKSKDRKRRKEKKHKKDKEKAQEKKQKHKESSVAAAAAAAAAAGAAMTTATVASLRDKSAASDVKKSLQEASENNPRAETSPKKQRKNPRLVSDRKRSVLDEASFEPDYSASDSDSDGEDGKSATIPSKKPKLEAASGETVSEKTADAKPSKKRVKSTSSEDYSTSDSDSSSSDTDSSEDSHRKRKKKHKKHKKRKSKKESSTDSDSYSDSSYTSSDDRHKKKAKKSKSKSKQAKKKKKARHK